MSSLIILGTFDGVHRGHCELISSGIKMAKQKGLKSHVLYFNFPPKFFFSGEYKNCLLTLPSEKKHLLLGLDADIVEELNFNNTFAEMPAEQFFIEELVKKRKAKGIVCGQDFSFGKNRMGNTKILAELCEQNKIYFFKKNFLLNAGEKISSSTIRTLLINGKIEQANNLLGRPYNLSGLVVKGAGLGRKMGFPTANLQADLKKIMPRGVFAVKAKIEEKLYPAVASLGIRPTLNTLENKFIPEVHILNFDDNLYDKKIEIYFLRQIRAERQFASKEELIKQVEIDKNTALKILKQ